MILERPGEGLGKRFDDAARRNADVGRSLDAVTAEADGSAVHDESLRRRRQNRRRRFERPVQIETRLDVEKRFGVESADAGAADVDVAPAADADATGGGRREGTVQRSLSRFGRVISLDVVSNARFRPVQPTADQAREFRLGIRTVGTVVVMLPDARLGDVSVFAAGMRTNDVASLLRFFLPTLLDDDGFRGELRRWRYAREKSKGQ